MQCITVSLAYQKLRLLGTDLSQWKSQSITDAVLVGFMVVEKALEQIYLRVFRVIPANRNLNNAPYSFTAAASEVCDTLTGSVCHSLCG